MVLLICKYACARLPCQRPPTLCAPRAQRVRQELATFVHASSNGRGRLPATSAARALAQLKRMMGEPERCRVQR